MPSRNFISASTNFRYPPWAPTNYCAAPRQELVQIEWLLNSLLDGGVEAPIAFRRTPLPEEQSANHAALPTPLLARRRATERFPGRR